MSEVKAIEAVDEALGTLEPDARARVLVWAQLKYGDPANITPSVQQHQIDPPNTPEKTSSGKAKAKTSKKAKTIISMDKSLDLKPSGKESAVEFATKKAPANVVKKCVVAVYYLRDVVEMKKVTVEAVFTFFKHLGWPMPTDLKNTLQQAGTAGWLDTADGQDIKLTSLGENLVEYELPVKAKAK